VISCASIASSTTASTTATSLVVATKTMPALALVTVLFATDTCTARSLSTAVLFFGLFPASAVATTTTAADVAAVATTNASTGKALSLNMGFGGLAWACSALGVPSRPFSVGAVAGAGGVVGTVTSEVGLCWAEEVGLMVLGANGVGLSGGPAEAFVPAVGRKAGTSPATAAGKQRSIIALILSVFFASDRRPSMLPIAAVQELRDAQQSTGTSSQPMVVAASNGAHAVYPWP
jgi:hypothetical protein